MAQALSGVLYVEYFEPTENAGEYRFDNGVHITVNNRMNGCSLGEKINQNIKTRLRDTKIVDIINHILHS